MDTGTASPRPATPMRATRTTLGATLIIALLAALSIAPATADARPPACANVAFELTDGTWFAGSDALVTTPLCMAIVTNSNDDGTGSLRAAITALSADPSVQHILVSPGLPALILQNQLHFSGAQPLHVVGGDLLVVGPINFGGVPDQLPNGGALFTTQTIDVTISDMTFAGSGNNGIGIFLPATQDAPASVLIDNVTVQSSRFHGVLVDGQNTTSYNTAGVEHPTCQDPHPTDSAFGVQVDVRSSTITSNGNPQGTGFDSSIATGCPLDFDGIRIDEGGQGNITFAIDQSVVEDNGSDGIELDERDDGALVVHARESSFTSNGNASPTDPDDGIDLDETGPGQVQLHTNAIVVDGNAAQGLDLDEADDGDVAWIDSGSVFSNNGVLGLNGAGEGAKATERGDGNLAASLKNIEASDNDAEGIQLTERGLGDLEVDANLAHFMRNGGHGLKTGELDGGSTAASFTSLRASANTKDGIHIGEPFADPAGVAPHPANPGDVVISIQHSAVGHNDGDGIQIGEDGDGDLTVDIIDTPMTNNEKSGLQVTENSNGDLTIDLQAGSISDNGHYGIEIYQLGTGAGVATLKNMMIEDNTQGGKFHLGIQLFSAARGR